MKMHAIKLYITLLPAIALAVLSILSLEAFAQVGPPRVNVGDTWTFENIANDGPGTRTEFTETVRLVDEWHVGVRVSPSGTRRGYSLSMNRFDVNKKEIPLLKFPLIVGNKWEGEWDWESKKSAAFGTNSLKYEVVAKETIAVPAGKFETFKIEAHGFVNDKGTQWGAVPGHPRRTEIYWYAPLVKRIIKYEGEDLKWLPPNYVRTWFSKWELKSYNFQTADQN